MKWIKYEYVCGTDSDGGEILVKKRIGYNESNLAIAEAEAYNGEYTIEDDGQTDSSESSVTANVNMAGNRITNLGEPVDDTDAVSFGFAKSIVNEAIADKTQMTPEFVNSIEECVDTSKVYVLPDGFIYAYLYTKQTVVTGENILSVLESYGDLTKGSNGLHFGYRQTSGSPYYTAAANCSMTGLIPIAQENCPFTLYIKGISSWGTSSNERVSLNGGSGTVPHRIQLVEKISASVPDYFEVSQLGTDYFSITIKAAWFDAMTWEGVIDYMALSFANTTEDQEIIVSYEPIGETIIDGYQWANTGHAFVPADYEEEINAIEKRATSLEVKTVALEDAFNEIALGSDSTLTYVSEEAKRVAEIIQAKRTVGSLTFTAMSDFHVEVDTTVTSFPLKNNLTSCRDAGLGLAEMQKYFKLDFAAVLGDYTYGDNTETIEQVKKDLTYVKRCMTDGMKGIPNIWATGNHDINYGKDTPRRMTEDELHAYIGGNNVGTVQDGDNIGRNYGYIDFENQKIRCIYLNTVDALDYPDNMDGTADDAIEITAIQAQWLVDIGLNFTDKEDPTKWGVITLSHHCLCQFPAVTAILTAYKDGASGSVDITTNSVTTAVNYDFTSENRCEIICAVHGHDHNFTYRKISSENWNKITEENAWLWSICVPNVDTTRNNEKATNSDEAYKQAFGEFDSEGNPVYYPKTQGTAKSTSFCVITIDRKNRKIHAIAYGAGCDRELDY